ncbi:MAG TPA: hypothetical protein DDX92_07460 [Flavobacteriales bacterium]|jgi:hypothetical protein|nr:hypothetical protein [Flavobacteriales bacterium]
MSSNLDNVILAENAGIIILSPFIPMLFERCGLTENNTFIDYYARNRAVRILDFAATGKTESEEYKWVIYKVLCGMKVSDPIADDIGLNENEKELVDSLLEAVTQQWSAMQNTSINGLRESFLTRNGQLTMEENGFFLKVEQQSYDMLLDQIPWNLSSIQYKWMEKLLRVEWR